MSTDGLTGELSGLDDDRWGDGSEVLPAPKILELCDRTFGEPGRRSHLFAWLRAPNSPPGQWLPVDAYYPRHRLVVVCHEASEAHAQLYGDLVPAHGLRLLSLDPEELGADPVAAELVVRERIDRLEPARPAAPGPGPGPAIRHSGGSWEGTIGRVASSFALAAAAQAPLARPSRPAHAAAAQRAARLAAGRLAAPVTRPALSSSPATRKPSRPPRTHRPTPSTGRPTPSTARPTPSTARPTPSGPPRAPSQNVNAPLQNVNGSLVVALTGVLAVELLIGVAVLALPAGAWLLALGLALDAAARVLGTIAARRAGAEVEGWRCALGGGPAVASFVLFGRDGPVGAHPAPLAGILSLLAMALIVLGAATALLHI